VKRVHFVDLGVDHIVTFLGLVLDEAIRELLHGGVGRPLVPGGNPPFFGPFLGLALRAGPATAGAGEARGLARGEPVKVFRGEVIRVVVLNDLFKTTRAHSLFIYLFIYFF
jgi:hypothetical protein